MKINEAFEEEMAFWQSLMDHHPLTFTAASCVRLKK